MARADRGIHTLTIPTPFAVGDVNAYLILGDPVTLIDGGPNMATSLAHLERELAAHGLRVEDLELLVVTHQHIDHMGLTGVLAERSGAPVAALASLRDHLGRWPEGSIVDDDFARDLMLAHGVEAPVATALRAMANMVRGWGAASTVGRPLADGDVLEAGGRRLRVLHVPGHSPTDTAFLDEERGVLIGGDHLLAHVSSNALLARTPGVAANGVRPRPLLAYRSSLARTRALDVEVVLGGHGPAIDDHRALIDERLAQQERRARRFQEVLAPRPLTAHEIAYATWGEVAITQVYLTLSEVLGHLDLLLDAGLVTELRDGEGRARFAARTA
jgi:glyoxylase-like metal-dependent hydrolase (beta-lactamase superfamily II)